MSHFTCFTIGDVDSIMEKYNEQDEKYFTPVEEDIDFDVKVFENLNDYPETKTNFYEKFTEQSDRESLIKFFEWYEESTPVYKEEDLEVFFKEQKKVFLVEDGKIKKSFTYYNTNAKYDYYCVIGLDSFARWGGLEFLMKDGTHAQYGLIKDLDIDGTINEAIEKDRETYREVFEGVGRLNHTPWKEYLKRRDNGEITIDEARDLYHKQPDVERFNKWAHDNGYWMEADNFLCTEEEYAKDTTFPIFCANILGDWVEKGEMGWWACVSNEKEPGVWKEMIEKKLHEIQETHPDEEFHVLDCHI